MTHYSCHSTVLCSQSSSSFELRIKKLTEDLEVVRRTTAENEGIVGKLRAEIRELTEKNKLLVVEVSTSCSTQHYTTLKYSTVIYLTSYNVHVNEIEANESVLKICMRVYVWKSDGGFWS